MLAPPFVALVATEEESVGRQFQSSRRSSI